MSKAEISMEPNDIFNSFWHNMHEGCHSRKSQYHHLYFGYITKDSLSQNYRPQLCTVVLRHYDTKEGIIAFHSDIRHRKINHIQNNDFVHCLFYSKEHKTQWRVQGRCKIHHHDTFSQSKWQNMPDLSKFCYVSDYAPATPMHDRSSGFSQQGWENKHTRIHEENADENFSIVAVYIDSIEWLYLSSRGHQRGIWSYDKTEKEEKSWTWQWLSP